jgi:hypothetical protein
MKRDEAVLVRKKGGSDRKVWYVPSDQEKRCRVKQVDSNLSLI